MVHVMEIGVEKQDDGQTRIKFYGLPSEEGPEIFLPLELVKQLSKKLSEYVEKNP